MKVKGIGVNKGNGVGRVLHINSFKDFVKIKGGEIIVTKNATPDYILILKKISCLVADQGGITCHIAIICREFETPAILATGNATTVLKDGMTVNFDAEKGMLWQVQ